MPKVEAYSLSKDEACSLSKDEAYSLSKDEEIPNYIAKNRLFSKLFGFHKDHFICLIIGTKGTGKTSLTTKILRNSGVDFDQLFIFSPTADQPKYQYLFHGLNNPLQMRKLVFWHKMKIHILEVQKLK